MNSLEYQLAARKTAQYADTSINAFTAGSPLQKLRYVTLGILGETGELCEKIKKLHRKKLEVDDEFRQAIKGEVGDLTWYIANFCYELEIGIDEIFGDSFTSTVADDVFIRGFGYDNLLFIMAARLSGYAADVALHVSSADEDGHLKSWQMGDVVNCLALMFRDLSTLAGVLGSTMQEVAEYNIAKLTDRAARGQIFGSGDNR